VEPEASACGSQGESCERVSKQRSDRKKTMLVDGRKIEAGHRLAADVCVIGGGAAAIVLTHELEGSGIKTLVLESGGFQSEQDVQSLSKGTTVGEDYCLSESRPRQFGGGTSAWGGVFQPLEPHDFEQRPWIPNSGWPITRAELDPYYARAQQIFFQPSTEYYELAKAITTRAPAALLPDTATLQTSVLHKMGNPFSHRPRYWKRIRRSKNVDIVIHSNAVELCIDRSVRTVNEVRVKTLQGKEFSVKARHFILAAGGVENARLLLASNSSREAGLGNDHDLVGRHFMEHPYARLGTVKSKPPRLDLSFYADGSWLQGANILPFLQLKPEVQAHHRLLGLKLEMRRLFQADGIRGTEAAKRLAKAWSNRQMRPEVTADGLKVATAPHHVLHHLIHRMSVSRLAKLRWNTPIILLAALEQVPDPTNRVVLSSERDRLGERKAALHFRVTDRDWDSFHRSIALIDGELRELGLQRQEQIPDPLASELQVRFGRHHMGTTRMHRDPKQGVVDENCRVHGIANIFVASSSVFPTGGHANATFTIAALTIRLADHLKSVLHSSDSLAVEAEGNCSC
jgi:choline dehydrogenase-like flavoprotein